MHHSFVRTSKKPCILVSVYIVHHENSHVKQWPQNLPAVNARSIHDPRTQASHSMYLVFTTHGLLASPTEVIFPPYTQSGPKAQPFSLPHSLFPRRLQPGQHCKGNSFLLLSDLLFQHLECAGSPVPGAGKEAVRVS